MTSQDCYTYRYDHAFLALVTFDNEILKEIIYESLNIKVNQAKIINSKMAKQRLMSRANYLDLVVETEIGYINIEVSNGNYNKYSAHRNFIYLTNLINNVTRSGIKLKDMPKIYQINLIFQENSSQEIDKFKLCSLETKKILTKKVEIVNIYIDKLKKIYYNNNKKLTDKLLLIGLGMTKEELEENKEENVMFELLLKKLDEMEDKGLAPELMPVEEENEWCRELVIDEAREEGHEIGIEEGIKQGIEQGKNDVIKNMLKKKFDFKMIAEITGLSLNKIKDISRNINY